MELLYLPQIDGKHKPIYRNLEDAKAVCNAIAEVSLYYRNGYQKRKTKWVYVEDAFRNYWELQVRSYFNYGYESTQGTLKIHIYEVQ